MSRDYLLVIGEAAALAWVLTEQRMAFPTFRRSQAMNVEVGDELLIYTTRGCFHNPNHDAGRVMGLASVTTPVRDLADPVVFGESRYTSGCELVIQGVAPLRKGVELRSLVSELHLFPNPMTWGAHLRRALVPLDEHDAVALRRYLAADLGPLDLHLDAYVEAAKRHQVNRSDVATD